MHTAAKLLCCLLLCVLMLPSCKQKQSQPPLQERTMQVGSSGNSISPLPCFVWSMQYDDEQKAWFSTDGFGAMGVLSDPDSEPIPILVKNGSLTLTVSGNSQEVSITVYDRFRTSILHGVPPEVLEGLASGLWYVTVNVTWRGDFIEGSEEYETDHYSYLFLLVNRGGNPSSTDEPTVIVSSAFECIRPPACILWSERYDEDTQTWICGEHAGGWELLRSSGALPVLIRDGEVVGQLPEDAANVAFSVYDRLLGETSYTVTDFEDLNQLPSGLLYICISITWPGETVPDAPDPGQERTGYEYPFALVVP